MNIDKKIKIFTENTVNVFNEKELTELINSNKKLNIKFGVDPSSKDLHLGHYVILKKLRDLQDLDYNIDLVIGDFTAMIGDPTGKNKTRPQLTREQVKENSYTYLNQVFKILDKDKTNIFYNSFWYDTMKFSDIIKLSSNFTVAQMLERNDFNKRYNSNEPISIHEFLYPLAQAYDSVMLKSDIEFGGTDQTFNLLRGRDLQVQYDLKPQICITMPLLIGIDGKEKMSKSLGNAICFNDSPDEMFGKLLSIPDELVKDYYEKFIGDDYDNL